MQIKTGILYFLFIFCISFSRGQTNKEDVDYVNVFTGTSNSRWMLGPYATLPFGMIQLGPDNQGSMYFKGRVWMGGYEYAINSVSGFSHIHAWTMGGLRMMPATADLTTKKYTIDSPYKGANASYHSRIMKESEKAFPGYYSVYLYDHDVKAEMTATTRCGFQRYTFPEKKDARILVDLLIPTESYYQYRVKHAEITKVSETEIEGYAECRGGLGALWNQYTLHFVLQFSKPFKQMNGWKGNKQLMDIESLSGKNDVGIWVTYDTRSEDIIMVKSGISLVSIEGARLNLKAEMDSYGWDFEKAVANARQVWNELLGKIKIEGGTEEERMKFYTNLYRSYSSKQTWNDVNGKYIDPNEKERQLPEGKNIYGGDAFWNSFWNLNGLWSLITPEITDNWVTTQLELFNHGGWTGKGPTGIEYSGIMEGSHESSLMVSAWQKGIVRDKNAGEHIYQAIRKDLIRNGKGTLLFGGYGNPGIKIFNRLGYIPIRKAPASRTLDYAYDAWCMAQMAKSLGKNDDYTTFMKRSENYKNVFHPDIKMVVPRTRSGKWMKDFDMFSCKGFIEGNSWQYSWYVPHDIPGLINLTGRDLFNKRLEEGFEKARPYRFAAHFFDRTTKQSAEYYVNHGNEVNMQAAYLFNFSGKPWLTQKYSRAILDSYYGSTPYHGWEGDEDEGQMAAWYVMSAMGMFEMDGGTTDTPTVCLSSPLFNKITIKINDQFYPGKEFIIEAMNNSKENIYIQSATLNGKPLNEARIKFSDIVAGGKLVYIMGPEPNTSWGIY